MQYRIGWFGFAPSSTSFGGVFDADSIRARLEALETESARPDLWEDPEAAGRIMREKSEVERDVAFFDDLQTSLDDAEVLLELAAEADDASTWSEASDKLDEAATVLGVTADCVKNLHRVGQLVGVMVGSHLRWRPGDIQGYVERLEPRE